jgi:hypothetical protein
MFLRCLKCHGESANAVSVSIRRKRLEMEPGCNRSRLALQKIFGIIGDGVRSESKDAIVDGSKGINRSISIP